MQAVATSQRRLRQASFHTCTRVRASVTQSDLWREHRFATVSGRYEITGPLREDALQRALQAVVARHPALRTTFTREAGQLWQQIAHESRSPLIVTDLTRVPAADAQGELERRIAGMLAEPMDPAWGPPLRAVLFRKAGGYTLMLTGHRMILDAWSFEVLQRDIGLAYDDPTGLGEATGFLESCRTSKPAPVAEAVAPPALPFRVRPTPTPTRREERLSLRLSPRAGLHLRDLARTHGTSPLPVFVAAFAATVGRYNEASEVLLAVAADGRDSQAARDAIGPFAGVLSLRCPVPQPGGDFDEAVRRTAAAIAGAAAAHPGSAVPQVRYELANAVRHPLRLAGCEVSGGRVSSLPGSGLDLLISETAGRFEVTLVFDPDHLARERVQALLVQYLARLGGVEPATVRPREFAPAPAQGSRIFLRSFASWFAGEYGLGHDDRCAVLAEPAEFGQEPLLDHMLAVLSAGAGACSRPPSASEAAEPALWLTETGITVVHTTTAMLARIDAARTPLPSVRLVSLSGSPLTRADYDRAATVFPRARIVGVYGCAAGPASVIDLAAEYGQAAFDQAPVHGRAAAFDRAAVHGQAAAFDRSAAFDRAPEYGQAAAFDRAAVHGRAAAFDRAAEHGQAAGFDAAEPSPLGDGTPFAQLLAVDSAGRPMPVNGVGEVAVRAPCLPPGHLPDPFGRPGVGLLRTGGRARVRPDLTLEYLSQPLTAP